jgi:hypothetical protein
MIWLGSEAKAATELTNPLINRKMLSLNQWRKTPMRFHIQGTDAITGVDRLITVEATDRQNAEIMGIQAGVRVADVYPAADAPSTVTTENAADAAPFIAAISNAAKSSQPILLPIAHESPAIVPYYASASSFNSPVSNIKIPLLISAISNVILAIVWTSTCGGVIFAVPMVILCVFEFILYSKADRIHPEELAANAQVIGIFEIIVGLFNWISLTCGIIVLIQVSKLRSRLANA